MCRLITLLAVLLLAWAAPSSAEAHLMVAQRGTLNFVEDGVFFVVSVPVSALRGIDDDGDGKLSPAELRAHHASIEEQIQTGFQLRDEEGARPLQGLLLNMSADHGPAQEATDQLVAMGRFSLVSADTPVRLSTSMFGSSDGEKSFQFKTRRGTTSELLVLTPEHAERAVFPSGWEVFFSYVGMGADHIFTGFDHLLFLLVVLATGWGFRQVLLALTCFTLGHAATLVATVWGGVSVSPRLVEPAIAATIVGLALYDWNARASGRSAERIGWRLALVFACALIHGLGLASSLAELGMSGAHLMPGVAGFNLGIELAQVAAALAAAAAMFLVSKRAGVGGLAFARAGASLLAMVVGGVWFIARVVG